MSDFQISGSIKDTKNKSLTNLHIQAMDNDQGRLEDRNDDLLGSTWTKKDGTFKIGFNRNEFTETLNFLREGNPDIYLIVRNKLGEIIHTTNVREGVNLSKKKNLLFDIKLNPDELENKIKPKDDPYSANMNLRITAFQSFGQRADFTDDLQRTFTLLIGTMNAWAGYNNEFSWRVVGYDGPLVNRYPWKKKHKHRVPWKK